MKEHDCIRYKVKGATLESLGNHALKVHNIKLFIQKKKAITLLCRSQKSEVGEDVRGEDIYSIRGKYNVLRR